jgi:UDP-N-acetylglucosamine--N-acetylmuramyl-(pentapeptide) pyrophosphoryl-undecaprenol N-acetylglucosamine transferase
MKAKNKLSRVLIMAGGTGGHVFPGLAVAQYLQAQGVEVHWLGTSQGLEARLVPENKLPLHLITISGLRGKGIKNLLKSPFKLLAAVKQAMRVMKNLNPDVVLGMGGFVSGPGGLASWLMRCPLIIHEQNAKAGITNRILSRFAKRVLVGFPTAFDKAIPVVPVGNPVRDEIAHLPPPLERFKPHTPFQLLVVGGSLGAQALNDLVPQALSLLAPEERPSIFHQTGEKHFEAAKKAYAALALEATLAPFIQDMAHAYAQADMVLCRAGALTVAELCAVGLGAILIPFPYATDDHQTANANFMVNNQAALCLQQAGLSALSLAEVIRQFSLSPEKRLAMAQAAYQLRNMNVTQKIYDVLCDVINE